jgi:hypothetical protein
VEQEINGVSGVSRSKRFRVFHVTSQGTREDARKSGGGTKHQFAKTPHKVKFVLAPGNARAECLECSFVVSSGSKPRLVIYNAEIHGQITELDCDGSKVEAVKRVIAGIRNGSLRGKDLR